MSVKLRDLKVAALAGLIALGWFLQANTVKAAGSEELIVAGGCFWCVESDFESVRGVKEVVSGYTGGSVDNPTYKQVTKGRTGHYEAVKITFNPAKVSREQLLDLFFKSVDPTDDGGQFCDRGDSYRTAIFTSGSDEQKMAEAAKAKAQTALGQKVVTPILSKGEFFPAEDYHQDYYKGKKLIVTRFGPKRQSEAYKAYRKACGRDARVRQLWGTDAPFVTKYLN